MQKYKCPACGYFYCTIDESTQNQWCKNCRELEKLNFIKEETNNGK
jgi:hypothetical protein